MNNDYFSPWSLKACDVFRQAGCAFLTGKAATGEAWRQACTCSTFADNKHFPFSTLLPLHEVETISSFKTALLGRKSTRPSKLRTSSTRYPRTSISRLELSSNHLAHLPICCGISTGEQPCQNAESYGLAVKRVYRRSGRKWDLNLLKRVELLRKT